MPEAWPEGPRPSSFAIRARVQERSPRMVADPAAVWMAVLALVSVLVSAKGPALVNDPAWAKGLWLKTVQIGSKTAGSDNKVGANAATKCAIKSRTITITLGPIFGRTIRAGPLGGSLALIGGRRGEH